VEPYKVIKSEQLSEPWQARFIIINPDTGEVLDDAQGYGYKTAQKAHAAWNYKHDDARKAWTAQKKAINKWLDSQRELSSRIDDGMWYAVDDGMPFTIEDLQGILDGIDIEIPYPTKDIYRAITK
jgi:hypothetical protein